MKDNRWRCIQIAATLLYRYCGKIRIEGVNSSLCDLIVTVLNQDRYKFAVKLVSSSFRRTVEYKEYLQNLEANKSASSMPIVLLSINEKEETATIGLLLGFFWNKAFLNESLVMNKFNETSWAILQERLMAVSKNIHPIMSGNYMVVKEISVRIRKEGDRSIEGKFVYLRNLSETYKMQAVPENLSFKDKFYRLLNGIPQQEYPTDFLDEVIQKSINRQFPDNNSHSSLMVFSTELRNVFLKYNRYFKKDIPLTFTIDGNLDELNKLVGIIQLPSITLNLLTLPEDELAFNGISLFYGLKVIDIANEIKMIFDLKPSYHQVKEYL